MSLISKYINFQLNETLLSKLGINTQPSYNKCYINYINNPEQTNELIINEIKSYIDKNYLLIKTDDVDINYYIEKINLFAKKKFKDVTKEMNIDNIISLCDYYKNSITNVNNNIPNNYLYWKKIYYKLIHDNILCGTYKMYGKKDKNTLINLIDEEWNKINFINLIDFADTLNKMKFLDINIDKFIEIIINKFDNEKNIEKLFNYIYNKMQYNNLQNEELNNDLDENIDNKKTNYNKSKYNFRFIIDNLKSNGYLLFEEFNKNINKKYKQNTQNHQFCEIKTDKRIINYFMYLISQKKSDTTNVKVNEILLRIKNYLDDIEESFSNNRSYRIISIKQESEKYKNIDLNLYNREITTFTILKYSNMTNINTNISNFKLNQQIEPYFDIYKSYYNSRFPDREITFDPIQSTMIVKMTFNSKLYYVHLSLIQYIVLDKLFNSNDGLGIEDISFLTNIQIINLQETINSLLHVKLIKRTIDLSINDVKLFINYDFVHENNKISICSLIINKKDIKINEEKEFLIDRNTIILSNVYDYVKKNKTFTTDLIYDELSKNKIPFEINFKQINDCVDFMLEKKYVILINKKTKMYKYCE